MVSLRRKLEQGRGPHVGRGGFVPGVEGGPA